MRAGLYLAFAASGIAGLLYELAWSRYLALFVGHSAYAQVLVISVFLGGLALGSVLVGQRSRRIRAPLVWYAVAEASLAAAGLAFHRVFGAGTDFAYAFLFPSVGSETAAGIVMWALAIGLILPQSIVLGTTFPLMAAGVLRADPRRVGPTVATLYFVNSLGGAIGVLLGGFALIAWAGLPGVLLGAATLNLVAAGVAAAVHRGLDRTPIGPDRRGASASDPGSPIDAAARDQSPWSVAGPRTGALWPVLLTVSFLTALASFIYEIGWIRMLSLVMGSATHSFELMLSAFILGLALGSLAIASRAGKSAQPLRLLGWVQVAMGITALATLPAYQGLFGIMSRLMQFLPDQPFGYALFSASRYGMALIVMLPSTVFAGMTLPLITATLLHAGRGERSIGWVYGMNTLGSVVGVVLAGLILLPLLGLEGMLAAGAGLDMALGVAVLGYAAHATGSVRRISPIAAGAAAIAVTVTVLWVVRLDAALITSGVFRYGYVPQPGSREMLYIGHGRTATVGVHRDDGIELTVLTTNGKPDASLGQRWLSSTRLSLPREPIYYQDESTQVLAAVAALAHVPDARTAAMIGHGSGVTGNYLLTKPDLERLVTIEIEPRMLEASLEYYPANRRVFDDPRSQIVIDDAKAFFSRDRQTYDLILSEPSNPWVSGTASLFTVEFYERVAQYLTEGGVFGQWLQLYEITDAAVLSVLAALDRGFDHYRAFLVGDSDLLLVATVGRQLPEPDWSVATYPELLEDLRHVHAFDPVHLHATRVFDSGTMAPLVSDWPEVNSDYFPRLDLASERSRFLDAFADGTFGLCVDRFDVIAALEGRRAGPVPYVPTPVWGIPQMRARALGAWLADGGWEEERWDGAPAAEYTQAGRRYADLLGVLEAEGPPARWDRLLSSFARVEADLHEGMAGSADPMLYDRTYAFLDRVEAPQSVRATVAFLYGLAAWDFRTAADAADVLLEERAGEGALGSETLLDGAVIAYLATGRFDRARHAMTRLTGRTDRGPEDLRSLLLERYVRDERAPLAGR